MAALCDWLYHLMALDPKAAFEHMFAEAVDALYVDEADDAVRLLESGPGTAELAELDAYRRGLAEVARALRDNRHSEALGAIERLEALEVTDELLGVAVDFLAGSSGMQVGRSAEQAVERFARVERQLQQATDERRLRLRATNLQWLAYWGMNVAGEDEDGKPGVAQAAERLETVRSIAERLGDVEMQAEAVRVHALVLRDAGDLDAALKRIEAARAALSTLKAPRLVATILTDKAALLRSQGSLTEARRELERAAQIGRSLDDPTLEADTRFAMLQLELDAGEHERASQLAAEVAGLRPYDPYLRNRLAVVFDEAAGSDLGDPEATNAVRAVAVQAYSAALEIAEEPLFYRNRGYSRQAHASLLDHEALREAADDLQEAVERGYREPGLYLNLAEIRRDLGEEQAASNAAYAELELIAQDPLAFGRDIDARVDRALALVRRTPPKCSRTAPAPFPIMPVCISCSVSHGATALHPSWTLRPRPSGVLARSPRTAILLALDTSSPSRTSNAKPKTSARPSRPSRKLSTSTRRTARRRRFRRRSPAGNARPLRQATTPTPAAFSRRYAWTSVTSSSRGSIPRSAATGASSS